MSVKQLSTVSTVSPSDDIWFPVQVNGEWLWKKIAKSSLIEDIRTIVVPAGQSFRIVDDAVSPKSSVVFNNRDVSSMFGEAAVGYVALIGDGTVVAGSYSYVVVDPESEGYGNAATILAAQRDFGDDNIKIAELDMNVNNSGETSIIMRADAIKLNLQTYADNAAALAAGLPVGADYNTPAGDRKVVV